MSTGLQLISDTWNTLQPYVREEKCSACECLQGVLVELRMVLEELPEGKEREALLSAIAQAMTVHSLHTCLGCEPCNPSDILADFYRAQQAQAAAPACSCEDG